jgi:serine/threonine protein kinase
MARFAREAQVLASLNHPNIAQIYGVEDRALVMELVEGEELRTPLPLPPRSITNARLPKPSKPRMKRALSIATSSPPTSRSIQAKSLRRVGTAGLARSEPAWESGR